jgi:hypothetical protein
MHILTVTVSHLCPTHPHHPRCLYISHAYTNSNSVPLTHTTHTTLTHPHASSSHHHHTGRYLDCAIREGLVKAIYRHILLVSDDIATLFDMIDDYTPPPGYVIWKKAE